jgi:hypothetical protein
MDHSNAIILAVLGGGFMAGIVENCRGKSKEVLVAGRAYLSS